MIQLPRFGQRLTQRQRRMAPLHPKLSLTALATQKAMGRERLRVVLETLYSYSLQRSLPKVNRAVAGPLAG